MTIDELIKILEDYEIFVDDDFGGSYKSIIAYAPDKKVSRAHTPIGTLKIIDTFEKIQNQNKEYKEVIDKAKEWTKKKINNCTIEANATTTDTMCRITIVGLKHLLDILEEVE